MAATFEEALELAREKYPYPINHYWEYRDYFVFKYDDGTEHEGGPTSPIVIRKTDMAALNYAPIFFNMDVNAEDVGGVLAEGYFEIEGASHLCGGLWHESDS